MKPNTLRGLGVSAAAAAAVLCWYLLSMEPDSLRPGSIADANDGVQFGELKVQGDSPGLPGPKACKW